MLKRCGPRRPEGVVVVERIAIKKVNLLDGPFSQEIEDIGARAAEPHNGNPGHLEFLGEVGDAGATGCGIKIFKRRLVLWHGNRPKSFGGRLGVDRLSLTFDQGSTSVSELS